MLKFLTFAFCGMAAICGCEEMEEIWVPFKERSNND
nr:MAG TPA: hypothetical protein [Caudoviricetes sp.]